ncbi:hypothetical protein ACA040_002904 [Xenophilus aerolatus]
MKSVFRLARVAWHSVFQGNDIHMARRRHADVPAGRDSKAQGFRFGIREKRSMNNAELAASVERLMNWVDYYLHCELDDEYQHDKPQTARMQLEAALREELLRAHAHGVVASVSAGAREAGAGTRDDVVR